MAICAAIGAVSAVLAAYDVWLVATIVLDQLRGPAAGTDFLNLYAGARLFLTDPPSTYAFDAQLALQRSLTARESPLVPFYLPPYAALLVSWLGWPAYPIAYLVWLSAGIGCLLVASRWLAPERTRWHALLWSGIALLFLPALLGLAQGQTSAPMLLCTAALVRGVLGRANASSVLGRANTSRVLRRANTSRVLGRASASSVLGRASASARVSLGLIGLALKPQFAPVFVGGLLAARCWRGLVTAALLVCVLTSVALIRLGEAGGAAYAFASRQKLVETFTADPVFLLGPTLLHASHWYLGVNGTAHAVAACLVLAVLVALVYVWRCGPAQDDGVLVQLALLPVAAIIVAPYALVYELTIWLASFWLLWRYTVHRPGARAALLWLTAAIWVAGDVGVALPRAGGADAAALLGLCAVGFMAWLYRAHVAHGSGTLALKVNRSSPRGSE